MKKTQEKRCKGKTRRGEPCRAAAMEGGLCFFHANPNKAAEPDRVGGRKNRQPFAGIPDLPQDLKTAKGVRDENARLIEKVYARKIPSRIAACLGSLLNLQMRVIPLTNLEERVAKLEQARGDGPAPAEDAEERALFLRNRTMMMIPIDWPRLWTERRSAGHWMPVKPPTISYRCWPTLTQRESGGPMQSPDIHADAEGKGSGPSELAIDELYGFHDVEKGRNT